VKSSYNKIESCVVFEENFSSSPIINPFTEGITTGVSFFVGNEKGIQYGSFSGAEVIAYNGIKNPINSIVFWLFPTTNSLDVIQLSSTHKISLGALQITSTGLTSPTYYVNGAATQTIALNQWNYCLITTATAINANSIKLGYSSSYFIGKLSQVKFFNKGLNSNEVKLLYKKNYQKGISPFRYVASTKNYQSLLYLDSTSGVVFDKLGRSITNTSVTTLHNNPGYVMNFNGSTSKLDLGTDFISSIECSIVGWIKMFGWGASNLGKIVSNGKLEVFVNSSSSYLQLQSDASTSASSAVSSLTLLQWYHFAVTRTTLGVANLYINGELSGTSNQSSGTPATGTTNFIVGNNNATTRGFNGLISQLQIFKDVLSGEDVSMLFNSQKKNYLR
jgi:hypothetical protein